jgi:hypothetical protein
MDEQPMPNLVLGVLETLKDLQELQIEAHCRRFVGQTCRSVANLGTLKKLYICCVLDSRVTLTSEEANDIAELLRMNELTSLHLFFMRIADNDFSHILCESLVASVNLATVKLFDIDFDDEDSELLFYRRLGDCLREMKHLEYLGVTSRRDGNRKADCLHSILIGASLAPKLGELSLGRYSWTPALGQTLADCLGFLHDTLQFVPP